MTCTPCTPCTPCTLAATVLLSGIVILGIYFTIDSRTYRAACGRDGGTVVKIDGSRHCARVEILR